MKRTKNERLLACFDAYQKTVGGRPYTTDEIVQWMDAHGLMEVPSIRSSKFEQVLWDEKFSAISASSAF